LASRSVANCCRFKNSSRSRPLNDSIQAFCHGLPGQTLTPFAPRSYPKRPQWWMLAELNEVADPHSFSETRRSVIETLRVGVRGYLTKDTNGTEVRQALPRSSTTALPCGITSSTSPPLRPRHRAGYQLAGSPTAHALRSRRLSLLDGLSNAEIAERCAVMTGRRASSRRRCFLQHFS